MPRTATLKRPKAARRAKAPSRLRTTWWGFPRENGDVGARNWLLVLSGTLYANSTCERVARTLRHSVTLTRSPTRCLVSRSTVRSRSVFNGSPSIART